MKNRVKSVFFKW